VRVCAGLCSARWAGSGLDACLDLAATPGCAADDLADARVVQSEKVADLLHAVSAARIGGLDRFISVSRILATSAQPTDALLGAPRVGQARSAPSAARTLRRRPSHETSAARGLPLPRGDEGPVTFNRLRFRLAKRREDRMPLQPLRGRVLAGHGTIGAPRVIPRGSNHARTDWIEDHVRRNLQSQWPGHDRKSSLEEAHVKT
jgi:hypothetical protein